MSEGPIKSARDAWKPPNPFPRGDATCARTLRKGRGFCGLSKPKEQLTDDWNEVTCPECQAARRADEAAKGRA